MIVVAKILCTFVVIDIISSYLTIILGEMSFIKNLTNEEIPKDFFVI